MKIKVNEYARKQMHQ